MRHMNDWRRSMTSSTWTKFGAALLSLAAIIWSIAFLVGGIGTPDSQLQRRAEWADIIAIPLAVLGLAFMFLAFSSRRIDTSTEALNRAVDNIEEMVFRAQSVNLKRLIGGDAPIVNTEVRADSSPSSRRRGIWKHFARWRSSDGYSGEIGDIGNFFEHLDTSRMLVLGPPGSGKTVLAISLIVQIIDISNADDREGRKRVPIRANLASYDPFSSNLSKWLTIVLIDEYKVNRKVARELVASGRVLPVLDGLDEMDFPDSYHRASKALERISSHLADNPQEGIVLTCRETEYEAMPQRMRRINHVRMQPLSQDRINDYIGDVFYGDAPIIRKWKEALSEAQTDCRQLLRSPLWLYLATRVYSHTPEKISDAQDSNDLRSNLLRHFIPVTVEGNPRFTAKKVSTWMFNLASHLEARHRIGLSRTDITLLQLWPMGGRRLPRVVQVCLGICVITPSVAAMVSSASNHHFPATQAAASNLMIAACIYALIEWSKKSTEDAYFLPISVDDSTPRKIVYLAAATCFIPSAFFVAFSSGSKLDVLAWALAGSILGGIFIITVSNAPTRRRSSIDVTELDTIHSPLTFRSIISVFGIAIFFVFSIANLIAGANNKALGFTDITQGPPIITLAYLLREIRGAVRYVIICTVMALRRALPLNLSAFLNWAVTVGLMRSSGGAFQFRHIELQEYLVYRSRDE
jgi:hypothetical protein